MKIKEDKILILVNNLENYDLKVVNLIKIITCEYFNLNIDLYASKCRKSHIVKLKQVTNYFMNYYLPKQTHEFYGNQIGCSHSNSIHNCKTIDNLMFSDKKLKNVINTIKDIIDFNKKEGVIKFNISENYTYIDLTTCTSIQLPNGKFVIVDNWSVPELFEFI